MKKIVTVLVLLSVGFAHNAQAFYYKAKCLSPQGKLKACFVDFSKKDTVSIQYKELEYSNLNREINGKNIVNISGSEKKQLRIASSVGSTLAFGPVGAAMLLWKKKMPMFGVEFKTGKNQTETIVFGVPKKQGYTVANYLHNISNKNVDFGMMAKK